MCSVIPQNTVSKISFRVGKNLYNNFVQANRPEYNSKC